MGRVQISSLAVCLSLISLSSIFLLLTASKPAGFSLSVIPVESIERPLHPRNLTPTQRIQRFVGSSKARANYLKLESSAVSARNASMELDNVSLQVYKRSFLYAVSVNIGTPNKVVLLLMDTGAGLIWTHCAAAPAAIHSAYNPLKSTSYRKLPPNHPLCRQLFRSAAGECQFDIRYGGGAFTRGVVATETFSFRSNAYAGGNRNKFKFMSFPNTVFGCSHYVRDFVFNASSRIAGILGLSLSPVSLISQLGNGKSKFSYCLVFDYSEVAAATSVLRVGEDVVIRGGNVQKTPFLRPDLSQYYYLNLSDISVGGRRMGFPAGTFSVRKDGSGGCFIDSGASISFMDRGPYEKVKREFQKHFDGLKLGRASNVSEDLEVCYKLRWKFRDYIGMTFHFHGADLAVEGKYMYFMDRRRRYFCLALLPRNGMTILGAWQQQNMRIVYDLGAASLQFAPADCSLDRL